MAYLMTVLCSSVSSCCHFLGAFSSCVGSVHDSTTCMNRMVRRCGRLLAEQQAEYKSDSQILYAPATGGLPRSIVFTADLFLANSSPEVSSDEDVLPCFAFVFAAAPVANRACEDDAPA